MSSRRGCREKRITMLFWRMVSDKLMYHHVNVGEPKTPIRRGQTKLPLRVDLPDHELISRLQERVLVNPQAEERPAVDLHELQH
jgi:hypothetical protein